VHYNMGGVPCNVHGEVVTRHDNADVVVPGLMSVGAGACVSGISGVNCGRSRALRCAHVLPGGSGQSTRRQREGQRAESSSREDEQLPIERVSALVRDLPCP
jgi:succinate dehydrogenase/fumarate reductase flavoprotein subunit